MINLYKNNDNQLAGTINEEQLQFLIDQLEEEYLEDQDYAFTKLTIDFLQTQGCDDETLQILQNALGDDDEIVLRWSKV